MTPLTNRLCIFFSALLLSGLLAVSAQAGTDAGKQGGIGGTGTAANSSGMGGTGAPLLHGGIGGTGAPALSGGIGGTGSPVNPIAIF